MGEYYKQREIDSALTALLRKFPLSNRESRKEFRKLLWDRIKKLIPLKPGKPTNLATEAGVRMLQSGMRMKEEILPRLMGNSRPSDSTAAFVWDGIAQILEKNIRRKFRRDKKSEKKRRRRT